MKTGKLTGNKKMLESQEIPTDRFYKRMEVFIFREYNDKGQLYYYCGDCFDDEMPYFIPAEWVIIK